MNRLIQCIIAAAAISAPSLAAAQPFDEVDACKSLENEVMAAVEESRSLDSLFASEALTQEAYLAQLYEGVQKLSASGQMFFRASDSHEAACRTALAESGRMEQMRAVYDWYLEPVRAAHRFFRRAREAAVRLNRQGDVDVFNAAMAEYDAAVMKLVGVCESDLAGTPSAPSCAELSARLGDALR